MQESAFDCMAVPNYPTKPRRHSMLMAMDYGMGLAAQESFLEGAGQFVDVAKLATGVSRVLPRQLLQRKIELYRAKGVEPCPGGMLFELAFLQGRVEPFFEAVKATGYTHVEISDNCIELSPEKKTELIRRASSEGLVVMGEVGKKVQLTDVDDLARDVQSTLEAGAWKVCIEAKELMDQGPNVRLMESLARSVDPSFLMFETPAQWFKGVDFHAVFELWKWLLRSFGPEVNIANVPPEEVIRLTCLRLGIGPDSSFERGAYVLSTKGLLP